MAKKRKRPAKDGPKPSQSITASPGRFRAPRAPIAPKSTHPVLCQYYRDVVSLRQYLLQQLPVTSKSRRRRIASLGSSRAEPGCPAEPQILADLLDSTRVGIRKDSSPTVNSQRQQDYLAFAQSQSRSILISTDTGPACPQSEVVDFVIWKLFNHQGSYKPQHLLTHGFQRPAMGQNAPESSIPGLAIQFPNQNVRTLKSAPWVDILGLLGSNGEEVMIRLLLDCGIFVSVNARKGIYYQLSGLPLSTLEPVSNNISSQTERKASAKPNSSKEKNHQERDQKQNLRRPNSILFLRRRMLYSRSSDAKGKASIGLGQAHVLNRCSSLDSTAQTAHVMKYIFPRQFGLQNAFTLASDDRENGDQFKIYNFREDEIARIEDPKRLRYSRPQDEPVDAGNETRHVKLPKRLRGKAVELVQKLRKQNERCSYRELLRYYCPIEPMGPWKLGPSASPNKGVENRDPQSSMEQPMVTQIRTKNPSSTDELTQSPCRNSLSHRHIAVDAPQQDQVKARPTVPKPKFSLTDHATPTSSVSAFCRAVFQRLIPRQFFGVGLDGLSNLKTVLRNVDSFIKMRRFESLNLHEVCKGLKITGIPWLEPPLTQNHATKHKISLSDFQKRTELLYEFIYYVFDAILIPLVRANFYVTESQTHRNRLFYFRHDVWRRLTGQPWADLQTTMFEEIEPKQAQRMLARRSLGFGSLRLLPKSTGLRPILNLRKRIMKETVWGGKKRSFLAPSINSNITPIHNMLNYERQRAPAKLGSSMHSVSDMHSRLKDFKEQLFPRLPAVDSGESKRPPLFFVKLDIQACFDTIPQKRLLHLVQQLVSEEVYQITKHVEIEPPMSDVRRAKPMRKFTGRAAPAKKPQPLSDLLANDGHRRKANTVFIDTITQKTHDADALLNLLDEHVRNNLVKMGNKYFRQRSGIPQGSVLSSLLCNFFYAELEREVLGFLRPEDALLMRLIDDFLLITPDAGLAMRFLQVMVPGQPSYGVVVNSAKSLVNFTAAIDGMHIPRLEGTSLFPYCGNLIDTHSLEIHRDRDRVLEGGDSAAAILSDSLTVEATRLPGCTFHRKVLASFRLQLHPMYLDDVHNSRAVVLTNIYTSLVTCAMKMYRYMKSLRGRAHPGPRIVIRTIYDLILQTSGQIQARRAAGPPSSFSCFVQRSHLQYLASAAFRFVLRRKQTRYAAVLRWLDSLGKEARPTSDTEALRMTGVIKRGNLAFEGWRF